MAELVKAATLPAFLAANALEPWAPGDHIDCCLALAAWMIWLGYPDPATHLRGSYGRGQGQIDVLAANGGAVGLIEACVARHGVCRVGQPRLGDIGALGSARNITRQFGVLHDGRGWLTRTPSGWKPLSGPTLAIWRP